MTTNSLHNNSLQPQNLKGLNSRLTKNRNNHPTLSRSIPKINLPTPSPTPVSPCFVHSSFDPTFLFKDIMDRCDNEPTDYSELAETTNCVRKISKKLGQARIQNVVKTVMIVTKPGDAKLVTLTRELALYLITTPRFGKEHGVTVYVNKDFKDSKKFDFPGLLKSTPLVNDYLKFWTEELCSARTEIFNFVITLGGDGTVLFTSWLFQAVVPPVLPFHLGSLGFLTNFDFKNYKTHLTNVMEKGIRVNLRMRFTCTVYRSIHNPGKATRCGETGEIMIQNPKDSECDSQHECSRDKDLPCVITKPAESFEVLNDLVVDRGSGPYMSLLELFGDDQHLTTVQADGLVISTPTGSTAYSVSAGGSLVHPEIPALLITPICPHTLSFRPMLLPDSMELRICVPYNSRSTAWASFDGRNRVELRQGDHIKVTPSKYPFPTVCMESQSTDWFNSISRCLRWNERERQKSFVVVEEESTEEEDEYENTNSESTENLDDYDSGFNSISTENDVKESSRMEMKESSAIQEKQDHHLHHQYHQQQPQQPHQRQHQQQQQYQQQYQQRQQQHQQHSHVHNQQQNHNKQHRRGNSKHTFACVRKNNSDASSNASSNSGEEQEWKVVRRQKKKKSNR